MRARPKMLPGTMNKLEAKYAAHLGTRMASGEIQGWRFEEVKLRLAGNTFYTPDFWVVLQDGSVEIHETKGFWHEHNRVKTKVAAAHFHEFRFFGVTWSKADGWKFEEFKA